MLMLQASDVQTGGLSLIAQPRSTSLRDSASFCVGLGLGGEGAASLIGRFSPFLVRHPAASPSSTCHRMSREPRRSSPRSTP